MTFKRIFKTLELTFMLSLLLIVSIVTFSLIRFNDYDEDYKNFKLGTHLENVREEWGQPNNRFIYQDTLIALTYNDGLMTDYVFKFDRDSKKLIEKWEGD